MDKISIFMVDDHRIFLQSFQAYLLTQPKFLWLGSNSGNLDVENTILELNPKVVLLDYYLNFGTAIPIFTKLRSLDFIGKVVFLTMEKSSKVRQDVQLLGADGFVSKDVDGSILLQGIQDLVEGELNFLEFSENPLPGKSKPYSLTNQEEVVAKLVCLGLSSEVVAQKLFISIHTVHTHRRRILEKTNSTNFFEVCQKLKKTEQ